MEMYMFNFSFLSGGITLPVKSRNTTQHQWVDHQQLQCTFPFVSEDLRTLFINTCFFQTAAIEYAHDT